VGPGQIVVVAVTAVVAAWIVFVIVIWLHRPSRALAGSALRLVPDLVRLVRSLIADQRTPLSSKLALGVLLVYLVSPIDLIPDFIPGLGSIDDMAVAAVVLRWAGRRVGLDGLRAHWTGSDAGFELLRMLLGV
jgi:uncharacterized membrane protein YkvA (DUF1232 family)